MKYKILISTIVAIALLSIVATVTKSSNKVQLQQVDIQTKSQEIEVKTKKAEELQKRLEDAHGDLDKLKNIEEENRKLQEEIKALQAKKAEKARIAEAEKKSLAERALNKATGTQTASAASGNCAELSAHLQRLGVNGAELTAGITLATRESSCRSSAINASSGACGEFQSWPCGKWGTPGTDQYLLNAIAYSKNRYGGFVNALSHSYANNWY